MSATVELRLPTHRYEIRIAPGSLKQLGEQVRRVAPHQKAAVICDGAVAQSFGAQAAESLRIAGYDAATLVLEPGEESKNLHAVNQLYPPLVHARLERRSPIVAVGGGVTGDTAGFVAATYLRGVPLIQCPTTLLAMVDASVGGKVGVNLPEGKNLVGAFHQPLLVVIDTDTLSSLPPRELRCGLAECVKHGVIRSAQNFQWLEENLDAVLRLDAQALVELVRWNVQTKAHVVMADEREIGERAHLNFGHTFAHAIEATTRYGLHHHGEAVSLGMVAATRLAVEIGRCEASLVDRLVNLLERIGLPTKAAGLPPTNLLVESMRLDKKVSGGRIRLVLPSKLGEVFMTAEVADPYIAAAWDTVRD